MTTNPQLTRNGVCYDLKNSPYQLTELYEEQMISYHFSSALNKERFTNQVTDHRKVISLSLSNRFRVEVTNDVLSDIALYKKIEKRGFYLKLEMENEEIVCPENLELIGTKVVRKN